jgi:hypothetical protein
MQNRSMERSAAYSGIVGAIVFVLSGVLPGMFPPINAGSADLSTYISSHAFTLALSAWLAIPAVAFILWFAYGLFDYLRDPQDRDRSLGQWGRGGAVVWAALTLASSALLATGAIRPPGATASLPAFYVFSVTLFVFAMGAFAAFAFGVAHESRRKSALPGWLNAFGYLVFLVDLAYTLCIFGTGTWSITGYGAIVAPTLSGLWIFVASIALLAAVPKDATARS